MVPPRLDPHSIASPTKPPYFWHWRDDSPDRHWADDLTLPHPVADEAIRAKLGACDCPLQNQRSPSEAASIERSKASTGSEIVSLSPSISAKWGRS